MALADRFVLVVPVKNSLSPPVPCLLPDSWSFYDNRQRFSTSDTEAGQPSSGAAGLHGMEQGRKNPRAGSPDRMAHRDPPTVDVDPLVVEPQFPVDREGDGGEGFIDLKQVDIAERKTGLLEHQLDRLDRRHRKPLRRKCRSGVANDARHRREPEMRDFLLSHDDQGGRPVITGRRIAHGQNAVFLKYRLELAQLAQIDSIRFFILCDGQRRAFPLGHVDWDDFPFEDPGRNGCLGAAVAFQGEVVELLSSEPVLCGTEFAAIDPCGNCYRHPTGRL